MKLKNNFSKYLFALSIYYKSNQQDEPEIFRARVVSICLFAFSFIVILFLFNVNVFNLVEKLSEVRAIRLFYVLVFLMPFYLLSKIGVPDEIILNQFEYLDEVEAKKIGRKIVMAIVGVFILDFILLYIKVKFW